MYYSISISLQITHNAIWSISLACFFCIFDLTFSTRSLWVAQVGWCSQDQQGQGIATKRNLDLTVVGLMACLGHPCTLGWKSRFEILFNATSLNWSDDSLWIFCQLSSITSWSMQCILVWFSLWTQSHSCTICRWLRNEVESQWSGPLFSSFRRSLMSFTWASP